MSQVLDGTIGHWARAGLFAVAISCSSGIVADDFQRSVSFERTEPSQLPEVLDAKPIAQFKKSVVADHPNAWKLRWRQPASGQASVASHTTNGSPSSPSVRKTSKAPLAWNDSKTERSPIRQVAQFAPVDPFDRPFGEESGDGTKVQTAEGEVEILQPGQPSSPGTPRTPSFGTGPTNPSDAAPVKPGALPMPNQNRAAPSINPFGEEQDQTVPGTNLQQREDQVLPGADRPEAERDRSLEVQPSPSDGPSKKDDLGPIPGDTSPAPLEDMPPMPPELSTPDQRGNGLGATPNGQNERECDRVYNRRNCCTEQDNCQTAREKIRNYKITNIPIDITPHFTNTDQEITTEDMKLRTLADAPSRTWTDRQGKQLGTGRLTDYRNGRIHITPEDGEDIVVPFRNLSDDDLCFVTAWWSLPTECPLDDELFVPRDWLCSNLNWKASALCHKPLYFEEVALERYGHTTGPFTQPFVSTAHFFGSLVMLPYQMGMSPPNECEYALGYYRPGNCAPWLVPPFPVSTRGALAEAGVIVGGIYVIP